VGVDSFQAENHAENRARVARSLRAVFRDLGLDIYPAEWDEALVEVVLQEAADVRERCAEIVQSAATVLCQDDAEKAGRIAEVLLKHRVVGGEILFSDEADQ
jgi:hypothetical protein